jgi:hypothetical protein
MRAQEASRLATPRSFLLAFPESPFLPTTRRDLRLQEQVGAGTVGSLTRPNCFVRVGAIPSRGGDTGGGEGKS